MFFTFGKSTCLLTQHRFINNRENDYLWGDAPRRCTNYKANGQSLDADILSTTESQSMDVGKLLK